MSINTTLQGRLNTFFNLKNFADVISTLPKPQTPMTDLLFGQGKRKQKTSPYIAIQDIQNETGAVPVILRGSKSYGVDSGKKSIGMIEVQPLSMNKFISGAELNNLIAVGETDSINAKLTEVIENLRDRTAVSTEILVCQSLSGKISYPASIEGASYETYTVEIGKPKALAATDIGASGKTIADLQKALEAQFIAQQSTGSSSDVRYLVGSDVYAKIVELVISAKGVIPVQWTDTGLTLFGKYKLMPLSTTYALPGSDTAQSIIDSKSIQTVDLSNTGKLFYAALDELDAKLQPLPFFASYEHSQDPSGIKVFSSSKPLPAFAVGKTVLQQYLA